MSENERMPLMRNKVASWFSGMKTGTCKAFGWMRDELATLRERIDNLGMRYNAICRWFGYLITIASSLALFVGFFFVVGSNESIRAGLECSSKLPPHAIIAIAVATIGLLLCCFGTGPHFWKWLKHVHLKINGQEVDIVSDCRRPTDEEFLEVIANSVSETIQRLLPERLPCSLNPNTLQRQNNEASPKHGEKIAESSGCVETPSAGRGEAAPVSPSENLASHSTSPDEIAALVLSRIEEHRERKRNAYCAHSMTIGMSLVGGPVRFRRQGVQFGRCYRNGSRFVLAEAILMSSPSQVTAVIQKTMLVFQRVFGKCPAQVALHFLCLFREDNPPTAAEKTRIRSLCSAEHNVDVFFYVYSKTDKLSLFEDR